MPNIETVGQPEIADPFKKYFPFLTALCCLASIILFIGINLEPNIDSWDAYRKWGSPSATDIFHGSYWGLISSNFLHTELWHIAGNLYWLWIFGKKIEFESSKGYFAILILSAALVSYLAELSFSDSSGIGLSGIVYSLFGFLLVKRKTTETYKSSLDNKTVRSFLFWLALCFILTQNKTLNIANAAHVGGLLWGILFAFISKFEIYQQWLLGFGLVAVLTSSVFWNPLGTSWLLTQADDLHNNNRTDEAIIMYKKILSQNPDNEFVKSTVKQLEIQKLQQQAYDLHKNRNYKDARKVYNAILGIDPGNEWAKESLLLLPLE